ncbi:Transposon TX1 uncharacterized protein [Nymphaea thermarum]|nr:Transposon TX1 uncharacterized protein [Nymphaea thermarum]
MLVGFRVTSVLRGDSSHRSSESADSWPSRLSSVTNSLDPDSWPSEKTTPCRLERFLSQLAEFAHNGAITEHTYACKIIFKVPEIDAGGPSLPPVDPSGLSLSRSLWRPPPIHLLCLCSGGLLRFSLCLSSGVILRFSLFSCAVSSGVLQLALPLLGRPPPVLALPSGGPLQPGLYRHRAVSWALSASGVLRRPASAWAATSGSLTRSGGALWLSWRWSRGWSPPAPRAVFSGRLPAFIPFSRWLHRFRPSCRAVRCGNGSCPSPPVPLLAVLLCLIGRGTDRATCWSLGRPFFTFCRAVTVCCIAFFFAHLRGSVKQRICLSVGSLLSSIVFSPAHSSYGTLADSSRLSYHQRVVVFSFCIWVIVPCGRGSPGWSPLVGQPLHLGVSPLFGVLRGFVAFFGLSLLSASDGASGGVRDSLGLGWLVLVRAVCLFRYRFRISSALVVRHTSALRWSSSRLRGFRPCFPLRERLPLLRSLTCSLPRSPEVPCLPLLFPALRAGASRESALCLSAGGPPFEVAVVARSCSTVASVVLAFGVPAPPVSSFPSVAFMLLFTLVTGPPMPPLTPRTSSFAHLLSVSSISFDSSFCIDLPSLHIQSPRLSRGSPHYPANLPLPPVSHALPHIPCVDSFSPALRFDLASASTPPTSPAQLPGATTRPVVCHSLLDRLPPVAPLLDAELGISLPDALAALKVSLPQEQLDLLRSSFVAVVAPVSRSSLARLRRELRRIGASAASILPPGAARAARCTSPHNGPSVLIVVETKMSVISHACVRTLIRQSSFGFLPANGTASGILLTWSPPLTGAVVHIGRYSISASLSGFWPNGPVLVTAVYGPCVGALRGQLWAELHQVRQLAGDFNCLLNPADSSSPVSFGQSMLAFRSFVDEFGLFDVPSTNGTFTWSNNRNPPILRRRETLAWKRIFWSSKFSEVADWDEEILSLQTSDNISVDQSSRLLCLQCLAQEWQIRESIHWQQRSRLGWLAHGDQNSTFFHLAASQRRRQMLLQSMVIGSRVFLGDDILPALSTHFRDFYSKPLRFRAPLPDFHLSSLSLSLVRSLLSGPFCTKRSRTPSGPLALEFNQATCVLVPKCPNPTDVTHFRPISILGTPYKIIAKLLSLRLAPVMSSIISPFQVAFIKGQRLQDAVVLANEVVHSLYCLRLPSFILKLDISKAFDSVSWEFLSDLLTRLAFGPSFKQWVMSLVIGAQLAVSFNGKCGDFFCLERGLRQGCPLSPLLFNMVAESFSALFPHASVVGFLTPHSLSHLQNFSTLQYADDFLLFGNASRQ